MFGKHWNLSPREHDVLVERNIGICMPDGTVLSADIFRPASAGRFPVLLGVHAYDNAMQSAPSRPQAIQGKNAQAEAGDPYFYARRGYVHVIMNARGTGLSQGEYSHYGPEDVRDIADTIAWLAEQPWSTGRVGMFGASYFSVCAKQVAATNPPALKAVFVPTDIRISTVTSSITAASSRTHSSPRGLATSPAFASAAGQSGI